MTTKKLPLLQKIKHMPMRNHWFVFGIFCIFAYLLFAHPDVIETSNHSYLLLDSIFKGKFFNFYEYVAQYPFGTNLYYINHAHYNIVIYVIFAVAELPVYLFNVIFGTYHEPVFYFVGKLVSIGFFIACIPVVRKLAIALELSERDATSAALFFALSAPAFFSAMIMAQYDSICLFFILLGLLYWMRKDTKRFLFWFGIAAACKFFALLLFVPLLLLLEKRLLHLLKKGLLSLWVMIPTTLLFLGRTDNMAAFNGAMLERLFAAKFPAAHDIPIFLTVYLALCVLAYLWKPHESRTGKVGIWLGLATFGTLFLFVEWHPQWILLLIPFMVLSTLLEKNRMVWWWLDILFALGFFLVAFAAFRIEGNLFDFGVLNLWFGIKTDLNAYKPVIDYLVNLPLVVPLMMVLFSAPLFSHILFKFPATDGTLATRLSASSKQIPAHIVSKYIWFVFGAGMACWLVPTMTAYLLNFIA